MLDIKVVDVESINWEVDAFEEGTVQLFIPKDENVIGQAALSLKNHDSKEVVVCSIPVQLGIELEITMRNTKEYKERVDSLIEERAEFMREIKTSESSSKVSAEDLNSLRENFSMDEIVKLRAEGII